MLRQSTAAPRIETAHSSPHYRRLRAAGASDFPRRSDGLKQTARDIGPGEYVVDLLQLSVRKSEGEHNRLNRPLAEPSPDKRRFIAVLPIGANAWVGPRSFV